MLLPLGIKQRRDTVDKVSKFKNSFKERGDFNSYAFSEYNYIERRALSEVTLIERTTMASILQHEAELNMRGIATP